MQDSERHRNAAEFLAWLVADDREGVLAVGADEPEHYRRAFDLAQPGAVGTAALFAVELGLRVALPVYFTTGSYGDSDVLRSHTVACRFPAGLEPADLLELDPPPNLVVWLDDDAPSFALWGCPEPVSGDELAGLQEALRERFEGDSDWSASTAELVPIPGVRYSVNGRECEAIEYGAVAA